MRVSLADIETCLPQTQCTRCEYPCCTAYSQAILDGEANINKCAPGGDISISKLSHLTGKAALELDPIVGGFQEKTLAFIIEEQCIGCVLCIKACPVDAIVGANKQMHTVVKQHCTGCELCIPVCPTDCIEMRENDIQAEPLSDWPGYSNDAIALSKQRFEKRQARLTELNEARPKPEPMNKLSRQQAILEAVKRRKAKNAST